MRNFPRPRRRDLLSFDDAYVVLDIVRGPSSSGWYEANCPAHLDEHASLGVKEDEDSGALVAYCHAGCGIIDIIKALKEMLES